MTWPLTLLAAMVGAMIAALLIVIAALDPPRADIEQLVLFMGISGTISVLAGYVLYRHVLARWSYGLRWSLLVMVAFTVLLVFANVWATARLMFINNHDLILTGALLVFAGLTALAFGLFVAGTLARKISHITSGIEALAGGDLTTRLPEQGSDELAQLARRINWMAERLAEIDQEQRRIEQTRRDLIAWVSHDLRTPLTAIRALLEAIDDGIVSEREDVLAYVRRSLGEVGSMGALIDDLFALAQIDAGPLRLTLVQASLRDLISDTVSGMSARARQRSITIRGDVSPDIDPVTMAPEKIQRVLYNLIDNAIEHTPPEGVVTIRARRNGETVAVTVHNSGSSIPAEHLPHIFQKFYRGESARQAASGGERRAGLGLAIARGLVEAHAGAIWAESTPGDGTGIHFTLPRSLAG